MEFFNKLGNIASETYKKTSKKTGDLAKEAKIRMKMNEDKGKIKDLYIEIGKLVYQKHIDKIDGSIGDSLDSYCLQIDEISDGIEKALDEILLIKGKRICENCHTEIDSKVKFCPSCGTEQPEIPAEEPIEAEIVENEDNNEENENINKEAKETEKIEEIKNDKNNKK